jgi:hypothetical protein
MRSFVADCLQGHRMPNGRGRPRFSHGFGFSTPLLAFEMGCYDLIPPCDRMSVVTCSYWERRAAFNYFRETRIFLLFGEAASG